MSNSIFQSDIYINGNILPIYIGGFTTINVNITGIISAGSLTPQLSRDGIFWENIDTVDQYNPGAVTLNQAGIYIANVGGWQQFRLLASSDFSASCTTQYSLLPTSILTKIINAVDISLIASNWVAGTYPPNSIVIYNGSFYSNTISTSETPGGGDWNNYATLAALLTFVLSN